MSQPESVGKSQEPDHESLRVEYQAAQESAQHHDNLVWSATNIMWGASLLLMGFILQSVKRPALRPLLTVLSVLGIAITVCVWVFALQFGRARNHKYERCKDIEAILHLQQHSSLKWKSRSQRKLYALIMVLFLVAWGTVLWTAWTAT